MVPSLCESDLVFFVFTGGPGHGKDYLLGLLMLDQWFQENASFFSESAEWTITGHKMTGDDFADRDTRIAFQKTVAAAGMLKYHLMVRRAVRSGKRYGFFSRHMIDGKVYVDGGIEELEFISGFTREEMSRGVTHVIWCGPPPEKDYEQHNPDDPTKKGFRFESYSRAVDLGQAVLVAYRDHHHSVHEVHGTEDPNDKYRALRRRLHELDPNIPDLE